MYLQRLMTITAYAITTSTILLGLYWLFNRYSSGRKRSSKSGDLNSEIEEFLKSQTRRNREIYRGIMLLQTIFSAMFIVAFAFFIVGGVSAEFHESEFLPFTENPAVHVALFGWLLWILSLVVLNMLEGFTAILTKGVIASCIPGGSRVRAISGREAISFGITRILVGFSFILLILYFITLVTQ